nr:hypothetical protein [Tanacetum cinerariifolium]
MRRANPVSTTYYAASLFLFSTTDVLRNSICQSNLFLAYPRVPGVAYLWIYRDGELRGAGAEVAYKLWGIPLAHPGAQPSPYTVAPPSGLAVTCSLQRRPSGSLPQIPAVVRHQPAEIGAHCSSEVPRTGHAFFPILDSTQHSSLRQPSTCLCLQQRFQVLYF